MRSRRNWLSQAKLRSTTHRHRPSPLPCSVLRLASHGTKSALIELPSTPAQDQSIVSERASQSKTAKWISCQIPPCCQSRSRTPASHARTAAKFLRQHLSRNTATQHEYDAGKTHPFSQTRSAAPEVNCRATARLYDCHGLVNVFGLPHANQCAIPLEGDSTRTART